MSESKPVVLRSMSNARIRRLVRMRENRFRRKAGCVLVDGWRETAQALEAGMNLLEVYLPESILAASESAEAQAIDLQRVLAHEQVPAKTTWVSEAVMEKISYGQSTRGVVAEFHQPSRTLAELVLPDSPLILILDQIEKPGNIGAVFRCADAAGIDAVVLCDGTDLFNPNAIRSSLGCVFHVPSAVGTQSQVKDFLQARGIRVLAARVESSSPVWSADLSGPLAIVLGSEANGLGSRWISLGNDPIAGIRIPMSGKVDSLNISVSAAVIAFEAKRHRETPTID